MKKTKKKNTLRKSSLQKKKRPIKKQSKSNSKSAKSNNKDELGGLFKVGEFSLGEPITVFGDYTYSCHTSACATAYTC